ncbi:MAG TPA: porin [Solimonas sp.]|nr:porin [Solimonas sp.]
MPASSTISRIPATTRRISAFGPALLATALLAPAAHAQESVDALDQRLKVLERKLEIQQEEADTKARDATSTSVGEKGFSLKKGDFEFKLRGLLQADARFYLDDSAPRQNDSFLLRRVEPSFEVSLGQLAFFRLQPQFAGDSATTADIYGELRFAPQASLRVGKFKAPVVLENLQSSGSIEFIERGLPTELGPNRDLGIQLGGEFAGATVGYAIGWFNGSPDGRDASTTDVDNRKETAARVFFEPFRNQPGLFQGLGFGIGGSYGSKLQGPANAANANSFLPRYRTTSQSQFFAYRGAATASATAAGSTGVYADGTHTRFSPQLYYYRNSLGLLGEYISSEQELSIVNTAAGPGATTPFTASLENTAWQVLTTWVITHEDASYRGVKPARPFAIGAPGWGAVELALRYGELEIDEGAFPLFANPTSAARQAKSYSAGINWYLTGNVKAVVNYTDTRFDGGGGGSVAAPLDREDEKTIFARLQLAY